MKKRITATVLILLMMTGCGSAKGGSGEGGAVPVILLEKQDISDMVSASGNVYSTSAAQVYSSYAVPVRELAVQRGDTVKEGDVLAYLDTSGFEEELAQLRAAVYSEQLKAAHTLEAAEQELKAYQEDVEKGFHKTLVSAQSDLDDAKLEVDSASAELSMARRNLREYRDYDRDRDDYEDYTTNDLELNGYRSEVTAKEYALEKALAAVEAAEKNLKIAEDDCDEELREHESTIKGAKTQGSFGEQWTKIQQLESEIEGAQVLAPIAGTVTSVEVEPGATAGGKLFTVQDLSRLKVTALVAEYDLPAISLGDRALIRAEMTQDAPTEGTVASIAPTSVNTAGGGDSGAAEVLYEVDIVFAGGHSQLRVGMNVQGISWSRRKPAPMSSPTSRSKRRRTAPPVSARRSPPSGMASPSTPWRSCPSPWALPTASTWKSQARPWRTACGWSRTTRL